MTRITRRSFLAASSAAASAFVPAASSAAPRVRGAGQAPSSVAVDVDRLLALGLGPTAELIRSAMTAELQTVFADRLGGQRLVVRLTGLTLSAYVGGGAGGSGGGGGGGGGRGGGGGDTDYLEGEALVLGPRGEIVARYPQLLALPSSTGGAWYQPDNEQRRIVILARYYAQWLRRTMG
ncbi:hypothetical protein [Methylobacterium isbiliense]|uniref:Uncharacterized protein n=1 Tax=Methylobacterium isbiliense TaxID=315478 RepID=A0ABQ4SAE5_9HYPH|nr:hypothetical protein [Methylobacterium isbiliense]MDN3626949.1 hypothetical protein [Methylobacterium isbiliense]GJD98763.1 hypothetical protein GMJLKIPL_0674 [Methylobacterium isbiliense]